MGEILASAGLTYNNGKVMLSFQAYNYMARDLSEFKF